MTVTANIQGLEEVQRKIRAIGKNSTAKRIARKAAKQAMNIVRDAARANAQGIDDPETSKQIWRNIVTQSGRVRDRNSIKVRVGVKGGGEFWRMNKKMTRKDKASGRRYRMPSPYYTHVKNDTRHWWLVEFGTQKTPAQPFMRIAMYNNIQSVTNKFVEVFSAELEQELNKS